MNDTSNFIQQINPDYVVNLSGPSSVYKSYNDSSIPKSICTIINNITTALIENNQFPNFYQASSSEIFKESENRLNEKSEFYPSHLTLLLSLKTIIKYLNLENNIIGISSQE